MSANDQPDDNQTLILKELDIPGRTGPISENPDVYGINLAAAQDNFPRQGLLCRAGPWSQMDIGDKLVIFWGTNNQVFQKSINKDEKGQELQMFVPSERINDGRFQVSYTVARFGQPLPAEPSAVMEVQVKLTRPGGHDDNDDPGHSKLIMSIPQDIIDGGIHKDNVAAGVPITIGDPAGGSAPYPQAAAGDVIRVSWGGVFVLSEPLTQDQADGKTPIKVHIDEATIRKAGDTDNNGLAVAFEVYDRVDNRSEDWSAEQRVVVAVDLTLLIAPLLKEMVNNVLDVDKLGDAAGTAQVIAMDASKFKIGDTPIIRIKGTPVEGLPIDIEIEGIPLISVPSIPEIFVPNAVLRQLAKTQFAMSFRLQKGDGSADLRAQNQFITAIGEIQRLAAPKALEAQSGAIDPTLAQVRIDIPFDESFAAGQSIDLFWLGTRPDLTPYLPDLPPRPITNGDIDAKEPLRINVPGLHLTPIKGGKLELYYQLQIDSKVLKEMDRISASHAIRESIHADILQVGEPRLELPEPEVQGLIDGALPADTDGTTLTVIYLDTVKGDEVIWEWVGSKTGTASDSVTLSDFTAGKEVPFSIKAGLIKGNEGGTVSASYFIKRAVGGTSYANARVFSVGVALDLKEPDIKEAPNGTSLDPFQAQTTLTAVVGYTGMLKDDKIIVTWTGATGTPAGGSHTTAQWPVTTVGPQEIPLAVSVTAFNLGKPVTVSYTMIRGSNKPEESRTRELAVLPIADDDPRMGIPLITQAANNGAGPQFDVGALTGNATMRVNSWPLIALLQYVWLDVIGTKKNGDVYDKTFLESPFSQTTPTWISQGFYTHELPLKDLKELKDGSELRMDFRAGLSGHVGDIYAVKFAERIYNVKAVEDVKPTLTSVKGSPSGVEISDNALTVETAVTLIGKAAKGQKVDVFVDGARKDTADADATSGEWTLLVSGLNIAAHTFKAKALYDSGAESAERTLTVVALVAPTLDNVLDGNNVEVPEGKTTVSTTLKLKGKASKGQAVEIFDGNGGSAVSKGTASAHEATGDWEKTITVPEGGRRLYAKALYAVSPVYSNVRLLTVTAATAPTITSVKGSPSGVEIPPGGTTAETAVTLTGSAAKGQKVDILDGITSKGQPDTDQATGIWTLTVTGLSVGAHSFKAKALYGSGAESAVRMLIVVEPLSIDPSPMVLNGVKLVQSFGWTSRDVTGNSDSRYPVGGIGPHTYTSENPEDATVDNKGLVKGIKNGETRIIVSNAAGGGSIAYPVHVSNIYRVVKKRCIPKR